MFKQKFDFCFEVWEIVEDRKKIIGHDEFTIEAYTWEEAVTEAWKKKNNENSLTHHYFYRMTFK